MLSGDQQDTERLIESIRPLRRVIVAFSGGVDSSVVGAAAARASLESLTLVTANSPSVPAWQLELSKQVAGEIGASHQIIATTETELESYIRNDGRRCFYCKQTLYAAIGQIVACSGGQVVCSGTNADDLGDYRPGIQAGQLAGVRTPLADLRLGKSAVRRLARAFGLSNADLPASPCLSSRIAYGVAVTPERLERIELSEAWLRERGFSDCRVRVHQDEAARVEVPLAELPRLSGSLGKELTEYLTQVGFRSVEIDPGGLRSGNLNQALVGISSKGGDSGATSTGHSYAVSESSKHLGKRD